MNIDRDNIQAIVNNLKQRISALEDQYRRFVKYCIEMIKNHRLIIDSELKNDPNTPRELLKQITMHGEYLENSVKLASSSIKVQESLKLSTFETFKYEVLFLISNPSEHQKTEQLESLLNDLEQFITTNYIKKDEFIRKSDKKRTLTQKKPLKPSDSEEINHLTSTISILQQKISLLTQESSKKDEKFQKVFEKLEKIQKLQKINTFNINNHCNSLQYSKVLSPEPKGYDSMPDMSNSSQASMRQDDSFDSRAFYLIVRKKLLGLSEVIKKFTQQACFLSKYLEQNRELESFMHTFRADTQEIGKVIEEIVTPRFKDEVFDKRKEINDCLGVIRKMKNEKKAYDVEIKAKEAQIEHLKTVNENLNREVKSFKGKVIANVKIIDNLHLQIEENNKEFRKMQEEMMLMKDNSQFLKVTRLSLNMSDKSSGNYSIRIEKNFEIMHCSEISIKNVYKNENLIRELRKMLKLKEKECADKDYFMKNLEKQMVSKESQTETEEIAEKLEKIEKIERPEFISIKNRFSYEENLTLSKKLSAALIEKAKIEEKLQISEKLVDSLQENLKVLQLKPFQLKPETEDLLNHFSIIVTSQILIQPYQKSDEFKTWKRKIEDFSQEIKTLKSENSILLINFERIEREKNEQELLSQISQEKLQIYSKENEKLMKVLKKYEDDSARQENSITSLQREKDFFQAKLEETTSLSLARSEKDSKNRQFSFNLLKKNLEKLLENQKIFIEKTLKLFEAQVMSQAVKLTKIVKLCLNLSFKQKISAQLSASNVKSLNMRVEDRENSILMLNSSLKLAESTIATQNAKNLELEKEKEALLANRVELMNEINDLNEKLKQKNIQITSEKTENMTVHVEKFNDFIKSYESSKDSLNFTIVNQEKIILSLQDRIKSLQQDLQNAKESFDELQIELKEGKKELKNEKNNLKVIENEMKQVKNDLKNTENELNNTKNNLKTTEHELNISKNNLKLSENEVKSLKNDLKSTENELKTVKTNLKSTEDDLKSLKNDLKSTEDELKAIKNDLKSTENELKTIKSLPKPEDLQKKIEILESQLKIHSSTASDIEVSQLKSVLQSQVLILDTECKRLEEKLKTSQSSKEKEVDSLTKKLDILSKQLAGLSLKNEELKRKIDDQENWKNEEFEVVKVVKFKLFSWFLIQTKPENRLIWTDQNIKTEVRDEFEELKIKYCKLKNYSFRLREEYKKILRKFQVFRKDFEFDKKFVPHDTNDEVLEITSPFISPRDTDMQLLYDGLKSARSYGTDFEDDTFGELSSKIVREGNSIFNASSFEEVNEDTDKINLMIEKMSGELQVKNEIIKNYEKTISELKSKVNNKE